MQEKRCPICRKVLRVASHGNLASLFVAHYKGKHPAVDPRTGQISTSPQAR